MDITKYIINNSNKNSDSDDDSNDDNDNITHIVKFSIKKETFMSIAFIYVLYKIYTNFDYDLRIFKKRT